MNDDQHFRLAGRPETQRRHPSGSQAMFNVPAPVLGLVVALVLVYALPPLVWEDWDARSTYFLAFIPARLTGNLTILQPPGAAIWSMVTYAFLHGGLFHLAANCLWLIVFGTPISRCIGGARFFLLAALSAVAGALTTLLVHWGEVISLIGASGAVSGMIGAAVPVMYARGATQRLRDGATREYFALLPFGELIQNYRAMMFMAVWLAFTLFTGASTLVLPTALLPEQQIAWEAHLGGFMAGLALIYVLADGRVSNKIKT